MFEIAVTLKPSSFSWFAVAKKLGRNECWKGGKQTDIWKTDTDTVWDKFSTVSLKVCSSFLSHFPFQITITLYSWYFPTEKRLQNKAQLVK